MAQFPPEIETVVNFTVIRPGDTLIIGVRADRCTDLLVEQLSEYVRNRIGNVGIVVIPSDQIAVYRPGRSASQSRQHPDRKPRGQQRTTR